MLPTRRLSTKRGAGVQKLGEGYANKVKKNKKYVLDKKKLQLGHFSEGVWSGLVAISSCLEFPLPKRLH